MQGYVKNMRLAAGLWWNRKFSSKYQGKIKKFKRKSRSAKDNMAEKESYNKPGPLIVDAQAAENWRKFIKRFEIYLVTAEKEKKADKVKVNLLLNCAWSDAIEEYTNFAYATHESADSFAYVCKKFEQFCQGEKTSSMKG